MIVCSRLSTASCYLMGISRRSGRPINVIFMLALMAPGYNTGNIVRLRWTCFLPSRQSCKNSMTDSIVLTSGIGILMEVNTRLCQVGSQWPPVFDLMALLFPLPLLWSKRFCRTRQRPLPRRPVHPGRRPAGASGCRAWRSAVSMPLMYRADASFMISANSVFLFLK